MEQIYEASQNLTYNKQQTMEVKFKGLVHVSVLKGQSNDHLIKLLSVDVTISLSRGNIFFFNVKEIQSLFCSKIYSKE